MRPPFLALPLVVGVTGHRDPPPDSEAELRRRFGDVLDTLQRRHPSLQLLVLSGLAAGADMIAAEEAIDRGIRVLGCLPMPPAQYEEDFSPEETRRFRDVLPLCWDTLVVGTSTERRQTYVDVADFIAYYSHVLVAFWDGLPARGHGGTGEVVEMRKGSTPKILDQALVAYVPDVGPVIQIVTPRAGQPEPPNCFGIEESYPQRPGWRSKSKRAPRPPGLEEFDDAIAHVERFNQDIANEPAARDLDPIAALAGRADAAANRLQQRSIRLLQWLYVATLLAGAAQLTLPSDGSFHIPASAGIIARVAFLAIAFLVFAFAKRNDFENRYQDYRAIAEALRVQDAWRRGGLGNRLVEASYLQMQQSELEWIRLALRTSYLVTAADMVGGGTGSAAECTQWVEGQLRYYEAAGKREERRLHRSQAAMTIVAVGGAVISGIAALLAWMLGRHLLPAAGMSPVEEARALAYWTAMPIALGSLLALLIRFYLQQRGFGENARRYQHMFTVFDAARRRLRDGVGDPRRILEQLGHEALSEHAEWLILHRERPLSFVHT
jgi:hypothetical protein